jgi:hypothetical protein
MDDSTLKIHFVTREDVIGILEAWQKGEMSAREVWDWAHLNSLEESEYTDYENDDSVSNEIICYLDNLDIKLGLAEDVPIHLEFLSTPLGRFKEGYNKWNEALRSIDHAARVEKLRDYPIDHPFFRRASQRTLH